MKELSQSTNPTIDLDASAQEELHASCYRRIAMNLESRPRHNADVELTMEDVSDGILDTEQEISTCNTIKRCLKERVSRDDKLRKN